MPQLQAQQHSWGDQPLYNFYHFPDEHKKNWMKFWESMDGDMDKIMDFAKKADIDSPGEWFESLHKFLFDFFAGTPKLLKYASKKTFGEFLTQIAKNHTQDPKNKHWYTTRGILKEKFIAMLERASDIPDIQQAVAHINARIRDLGFHLYSEYLLSKTKDNKDLKSVASRMNRDAFKIECEVADAHPLENLAPGKAISHKLFADESFMVTQVFEEDGVIQGVAARDIDGKRVYMEDVWNVEI